MSDHDCTYPPNGFLETSGSCVCCNAPLPEPGADNADRLAERLQRAEESRDEECRRTLRWAGIFCEIRDACNEAAATGGGIDPAAVLEIMKHHQADDPGTATRTEWGVAYEGDEQPGVLFGVRDYDDREDAETTITMGLGDVLVTRTVTATPWQRAEVSGV